MKILLTGANGFVGARIRAAAPVICAPSLRGGGKRGYRPPHRHRATGRHPSHRGNLGHRCVCQRPGRIIPRKRFGAGVFGQSRKRCEARCCSAPIRCTAAQRAISRLRKTTLRPQISTPKRSWKWKIAFSRSTRTPSCCVRRGCTDMPMFGVPNRSNLITMFLNAAITQKPLALSKEEFRGITYVREVAEQTLQAVNLPGGAYNFGSEADVSMYALAELFMKKQA